MPVTLAGASGSSKVAVTSIVAGTSEAPAAGACSVTVGPRVSGGMVRSKAASTQ